MGLAVKDSHGFTVPLCRGVMLNDPLESQPEKCIDCARIHRERIKEEKILFDIGLKKRFHAHTMFRHEQTWLNFDHKFIFCTNCFCILIRLSDDYGTVVPHSNEKYF